MPNEIVLDIETQNTFADVGGYFPDKLKISLMGVYFYDTDTYETFLENDLLKLWPRLERADRIIGFNQKSFDNPVINTYYAGNVNQIPQLDLLEVIAGSLGYRVKLDSVAQATIGMGKTGHGLQAVEFWREGRIKELADYCLMDVKVTKDVYEFGRAHGYVKCADRGGQIMEIPVDFSVQEVLMAINLTMPI
ncbi:MAG: ribonuclease H-like domain-containing protein [Patescibacteria group bacterium]